MLSYRPIFLFLKSDEVHEEMWITRHHESGNPSHGRSVLDYLRSRQEEFSIVSPESNFAGLPINSASVITAGNLNSQIDNLTVRE